MIPIDKLAINSTIAEQIKSVDFRFSQLRQAKLRREVFVMFRKELSFAFALLIVNFTLSLPSNVEQVVFESPLSPEKSKIFVKTSFIF